MSIIPNEAIEETVQNGNEGINRQITEPVINSGLI